jgi:hypothetical protein
MQSVINYCSIWSSTGINTPTPSQPLTVRIYCIMHFDTGEGMGVEPWKVSYLVHGRTLPHLRKPMKVKALYSLHDIQREERIRE